MNAALLLFGLCVAASVAHSADPGETMVQTVPLDPSRPYFVPTNPRVTTTIRFPGEIGAPEGAVTAFSEDLEKHAAEYLIAWQQGDPYFTVTPIGETQLANLNVPYQGSTYVVCFYAVPDPLRACACVNLVASTQPDRLPGGASPGGGVLRRRDLPIDEHAAVTPARLVGFLDRLKLIHATPPGPALGELASAMNLQIAANRQVLGVPAGVLLPSGISAELPSSITDAGLFDVVLLRVARDSRLNLVGFVCLLCNKTDQTLHLDVNGFAARAGAEHLAQRISDAPAVLNPREQAPAYFAIQPPRNSPLLAANDWRITAELVSPVLNPGAAVARAFAKIEALR